MIEDPPLLTIRRPGRRPTAAQIAAFQSVSTGFVVDAMRGGGALASSIRALGGGRDLDCRAAGPALTADNGPADVLATLAALEFLAPGDMLVAACDGFQGCAAAGDSVIGMAHNCGAAGFVTDGPVRDHAGIVEVGLPVWCSGLTPGSPYSQGPGRVGFPVQIGGRQVDTGDMVVADRDGVVVVPFERIDEVIAMLPRVAEMEAARDARVAQGLRLPEDIRDLLNSDKARYE